ncbi:hypothetical protein CesoFtcFv8_027653 [Champsocephalus esox]|uniref:Uncharacterized protein n=1 Tax=Champsocephalus esox TaxID=159716 RepID=A0AAN7YCT7_9TELE|nr:hypothetical protein CesoFtcFv8_027653 [Champsocephalus esox]
MNLVSGSQCSQHLQSGKGLFSPLSLFRILWHLLIPRSLDVSAVNREISGARRSGAQAQRPTSAQRRRLRVHQQQQQQHHSHPSSSGRKEYIHTPALSPVF